MLGNLQLDGFRGFETYSLNELTRVNLLVGKNNCGKTSILEAIEFLVSGAYPPVLERAAARRGEVSGAGTSSAPGPRPDISHFFFGHRLDPGAGFRLSGDGYRAISVEIRLVDDTDDPRYFGADSGVAVPFVFQIKSDAIKEAQRPASPSERGGALPPAPSRGVRTIRPRRR